MGAVVGRRGTGGARAAMTGTEDRDPTIEALLDLNMLRNPPLFGVGGSTTDIGGVGLGADEKNPFGEGACCLDDDGNSTPLVFGDGASFDFLEGNELWAESWEGTRGELGDWTLGRSLFLRPKVSGRMGGGG